jgi:hypothetical protein
MKILMKDNVKSIAFIYGVYWRMEKLINTSISFVLENTEAYRIDEEIIIHMQIRYRELADSVPKYLSRSGLKFT